jgi:starch synthase (maltosyl-transferring)
LRFHAADNDQLLVYTKATPDHGNIIACVVNLDTYWPQSGWVEVPAHEWGIPADQPYVVHDLMDDQRYTWRGNWNWVRLDPSDKPAHVLRVEIPRY